MHASAVAVVACQIDQQLPFESGIVDEREPSRPHPARVRKQEQAGRELLERPGPADSVVLEDRIEGGVVSDDCARVADGEPGALLGPSHLERHDRHPACVRLRERGHEVLRPAYGLQDQPDRAGGRHGERVAHVVPYSDVELLSGGDREIELETSVVVGERRPRRAGVTDERHVARPRGAGRPGEGDSQPGVEVVEAHAVAAANRDSRLFRDVAEAPDQAGLFRLLQVGPAEDHGGAHACGGRLGERALEAPVGEPQHHQIGHFGERVQR